MIFECDDGMTGKPCEACRKAKAASMTIYEFIVKHSKENNLTETETIVAAIFGALTAAETTAGKENAAALSVYVGDMVRDWLDKIYDAAIGNEESQKRELLKSVDVANVISGNGTLN